MIAASAVLVVVALVLLIVGVFQTGLELVFASIAASIVAAISLFWGVLRDRRAPAGVPGYPAADGAPVGGLSADTGSTARPAASPVDEELPTPDEAPTLSGVTSESSLSEEPPALTPDEEAPSEPTLTLPEIPDEPVAAPVAKKPAAKRKTAKKPAAKKKTAAKKPAAKKKTTAKKTTAKKAAKKPAKKPAAKKKTTAKKTTAKKPASE